METICKHTVSFKNHLAGTFLLLVFILPLSGFAQTTLGISALNMPDTVYMKDNVTVKVTVRNVGTTPFTGTIESYYAQSGQTIIYSPILIGTTPLHTLNPKDTTSLNRPIYISPAVFNPGNNIVVVWPTSSGIEVTSKPAYHVIFVIDTFDVAGIHERDLHSGIHVFPVPASSLLFIESNTANNTIEGVRIYDVYGKIILDISSASPALVRLNDGQIKVDVSSLSSGYYILETTDARKQQHRTKFVKSAD